MEQLGLPFDAKYPELPGFKTAGTSRAAAEKIKPRAQSLRKSVLGLLKDAALTADECAAKLGESVLSIRPRLSQLLAEDPPKIYDTGHTRANDSGLQATVWRAV